MKRKKILEELIFFNRFIVKKNYQIIAFLRKGKEKEVAEKWMSDIIGASFEFLDAIGYDEQVLEGLKNEFLSEKLRHYLSKVILEDTGIDIEDIKKMLSEFDPL